MLENARQLLEDLANLASIRESLAAIEAQNQTIITNQEKLMSGLTDAQAAIATQGTNLSALLAEWNTFLADVQGKITAGDSDAAVEALAQQIDANNTQIANLTSTMQSDDPANASSSGSSSSGTGESQAPAAG